MNTKKDNKNFNEFFQKKIYKLILNILKLIEKLPNDSVSRAIKDQLARSIISIGANQIEAQSASSKRDFLKFYYYSLKSANESKFWLTLLKDTGKAEATQINSLLKETDEIIKLFSSIVLKIKNKTTK